MGDNPQAEQPGPLMDELEIRIMVLESQLGSLYHAIVKNDLIENDVKKGFADFLKAIDVPIDEA